MRIALDARYIDGQGSGISTYTRNLVRAMLRVDSSVEFLLVRCPGQRRIQFDSPRVLDVSFPGPPNFLHTNFVLGPFLRRQDFDLFHSPFAVAPVGLNKPLAVTVHDIMWMVNPRYISKSPLTRLVSGTFFRENIKHALSKANLIFTVSQATKQAIIEREPWYAEKITVTYNGLHPETFHAISEEESFAALQDIIPPKTPFVLTVGDASPHKNHLQAVRGFLHAFSGRPEYRMILVRRFMRLDEQMRALLATPAAKRQVITLPHVSSETLNALYNAARIFLYPSYYEGFGIPILEAMAVGTPVVTSRLSSLPEVAGDAALLTNPADYHDIGGALLRLDKDETLRGQLIEAGYRRAKFFSWERCAQDTLTGYRKIVAA